MALDRITEATYKLHALRYMQVRELLTLDEELGWLQAAAIRPGLVLDAGCGPGRDLGRLADLCGNAVGVDLSAEMVELASKRVAGRQDCEVIRGDIARLPLADCSVSALWCSTVLPHCGSVDTSTILREFARVLQETGVLVCTFKRGVGEGYEVAEELGHSSRWQSYVTTLAAGRYLSGAGLGVERIVEWNEAVRFPGIGRDLEFLSIYGRKGAGDAS